MDGLLAYKRFCLEKTVYQIGTMEDTVPPETLLEIMGEFMLEMQQRFGWRFHVID